MEDITALKQNKIHFLNGMLLHKRPFTPFNTFDNKVSIDKFQLSNLPTIQYILTI